MTVLALCVRCQSFAILPGHEPSHCRGTSDRPGIRGLLGSGFRCSCPCRDWEEAA